jgi:CRP/FNR family transcriptional regulator
VSPEKIDEFRACGAVAIYKARQVIFHEGTPAVGLYILCYGAVKLYQSDRFGHDHILCIAVPGDLLGELPLDPTEPYSVSAEVLTESQLCYLPRERLVDFIQANPTTSLRLIAALSKALSAARRKAGDLALKPAETRLAEVLVQLASAPTGEAAPSNPTRVALGYSRREIAEMIGVSTETVIRLLGRLRRKGLITSHGREIVISDVQKLSRIANHVSMDARASD